jgi:hypothetical protein
MAYSLLCRGNVWEAFCLTPDAADRPSVYLQNMIFIYAKVLSKRTNKLEEDLNSAF